MHRLGRAVFAAAGLAAAWGAVARAQEAPFDRYFDFRDDMDLIDKFAAFVIGLAPRGTHRPYTDLSFVSVAGRSGPSVASGCPATGNNPTRRYGD